MSVFLTVLSSLALVCLGLITIVNNPKDRSNKLFVAFCSSLAAWVLTNFLADYDINRSLIWTRLAFTSIVLATMFFRLFITGFPRKVTNLKVGNSVLISLGVGTAAITLTGFFIPSIKFIGKTSNVVTGPLYPAFILFFVVFAGLSLYVLIKQSIKLTGMDRARARLILEGLISIIVIGSVLDLFLPLLTGNNKFAAAGTYSTVIFAFCIYLAIIKHRLFDIRLVVARSIAYALSIAAIVGIYAILTLVITNVIAKKSLDTGLRTALAFSSVVSALSFPYVKHFFDRISNSIFYRDAYEPKEFLDELNTILVTNFELNDLLAGASKTINKYLKSEFSTFSIHSSKRKHLDFFAIKHTDLSEQDLHLIHIALDAKKTQAFLVMDVNNSKAEQILNSHLVDAAVCLVTHKQEVGYLFLGQKKSGNIYSEQDLKMMEIIGEELAIAIENALRFEEIKQFNITLQQKVDEATLELRHANTKLKELDKTKDEFISMASHQLRTPLTTIKGYLSMVLEGDAGVVKPKQKEMIQQSFDSATRMVYLIADLLNVSRLQSGKFVITNKPTNLADVVEGEVKQLAEQAKNRKITMNYDKPQNFPLLNLDEDKIRQVVMNLLDNALYYTPAGGTVTAMLAATPDSVSYTVTDTGVGVPKAVQPHLFTKFYRADSARKMRPDGTGLGLYMAKKVLTAQGGGIIFKSEEGKGSTFGFTVPRRGSEIKG